MKALHSVIVRGFGQDCKAEIFAGSTSKPREEMIYPKNRT